MYCFFLEILEWVEKQMKERQGTAILSSGPHGAEGSSAHGQWRNYVIRMLQEVGGLFKFRSLLSFLSLSASSKTHEASSLCFSVASAVGEIHQRGISAEILI